VDPEKNHEFLYSGGIAEFIKHLNRGKSVLHEKPIHFEADRELPNEAGTLSMEVALQYNDGYSESAFQLRQQYQYGGWRHASDRLPHGAHAHD
jgi:DNA gyrase subunit B